MRKHTASYPETARGTTPTPTPDPDRVGAELERGATLRKAQGNPGEVHNPNGSGYLTQGGTCPVCANAFRGSLPHHLRTQCPRIGASEGSV